MITFFSLGIASLNPCMYTCTHPWTLGFAFQALVAGLVPLMSDPSALDTCSVSVEAGT